MPPAVSVVIPVFNAEKFLRRCLDSVCDQTLRELEIVCVDDASTDGSAAILAEYAGRDPRVRLVSFPENRGAAAARNAGIDVAQGEYLGFVDSDDFVDPDFYEKLYALTDSSAADAVKGTLKMYDNDSGASRFVESLDINARVREDKACFYYTFTTAIFRRAFVSGHGIRFPEGLVHFEDPVFTIKAALHYRRIAVCDDAVYYYCGNLESATANLTERHARSMLEASRTIRAMLGEADVSVRHRLIVYDYVMDHMLAFYRHEGGDPGVAAVAAIGVAEMLSECPVPTAEWLKFRLDSRNRSRRDFILRELRRNVRKTLDR